MELHAASREENTQAPASIVISFRPLKDLKSSAPASHLLAQALVSTDALLHDEDARAKLRELVVAEGGRPDSVPERVHTLVLVLAHAGAALTPESLFTFTQVTLVARSRRSHLRA
jgi:uncharacterized protein (TIGR04141 family)